LSLDKYPCMAYRKAGDGLTFVKRNATLDVDTTVPSAPKFTGQFYNPMDACGAFFMDLLDPDLGNEFLSLFEYTADTNGETLGDQAIFKGVGDIFMDSPAGMFYVDLYLQHGSEMGSIGLKDPRLIWDAYEVLQNLLPGLEALATGHGEDIIVTQEIVDDNLDIWSRIAAAGSPALEATISAELAKYDNLQDFAGESFRAWAETLGVLSLLPTPTPTNAIQIELEMPSDAFAEGDVCSLSLTVYNPGTSQTVDLYILLDVLEEYWCFPSWRNLDSGIDFQRLTVDAGLSESWTIIPSFTMPAVNPFGPMFFYSVMFEAGTLSLDTIESTIASVEFYLE